MRKLFHGLKKTGHELAAGFIDHDDRKPLDRWLQEQNRYAFMEAKYRSETPAGRLNFSEKLRRKIVLALALVLFYTHIAKGLSLDGWPGWYYLF